MTGQRGSVYAVDTDRGGHGHATGHTVRLGHHQFKAAHGQTLLDAALQAGLPFPYSCRVGGCGTCRCRIVQGQVRELTDSAYLLDAAELQSGTVLACQSLPLSDLAVEVALPAQAIRQQRRGRITAQQQVATDITALTIQLDAPLDYQPGQYAELTLDLLPGQPRPYSMATPPRPDGVLRFLVRHVDGGVVSTAIATRELTGCGVTVQGPGGDFWLRDSPDPLLLVAAGSGIAPLLAMLEDGVGRGLVRPVTLVLVARDAAALPALDELSALTAAWRGPLRLETVLTAGYGGGEAGHAAVAQTVVHVLEPGAHAYLCGPAGLVDAMSALLREQGVAVDRIHADRFTSRAGAAPASPAAPIASAAPAAPTVSQAGPSLSAGGLWHTAKFGLFHLVGLLSLVSILGGGQRITAGLAAVLLLYLAGDAVAGDDRSVPQYRDPRWLTWLLWLALPLLVAIVAAGLWVVAAGAPLTWGQHGALVVLLSLMIGMVGTIPAHELTHRTWDPISMLVGRWLLAFSLDTIFAIEHVYGHHRYVATRHDPATAPRGRSVYAHIVASTWRGNVSAWQIESARLAKRGLPAWSWRNAWLRGHAMSASLIAAAFGLGGSAAGWTLIAAALGGKALLEIVNYMEHYGLVRDPATAVQPRHSWNSNKRVTSWTMFNLSRHSHHHAQGEVPFQALRPCPDAPEMAGGYLSTILLTLLPPLWFRLMAPKLRHWDEHFATPAERQLAANQSHRTPEDSAPLAATA